MITSKKENRTESGNEVKVTRASVYKEGAYAFDMVVNGVTIYGCWLKQGTKNGKDYSFIDFPSRKGSDGKYYNHAWFNITKEVQDNIEKQIEGLLNG